MSSRLFVRSKGKLGRRMARKKRSHKDDCASTKRCNILSAPGNVDSTRQTDPRAETCSGLRIYSHFPILLPHFLYYSRFFQFLFHTSFALSQQLIISNRNYYRIVYRWSTSREIRESTVCVNNYFQKNSFFCYRCLTTYAMHRDAINHGYSSSIKKSLPRIDQRTTIAASLFFTPPPPRV